MPKELTFSDRGRFAMDGDGNEHMIGSHLADGPLRVYPAGSAAAKAVAEGPYFEDAVHVGWSKDQFVEIGVARFETSREISEQGFYTTLDRAGINHLIRTLKKARDAAFGKDE